MLDNVYVKTGGSAKCFKSGGSADHHGAGETIELHQGACARVWLFYCQGGWAVWLLCWAALCTWAGVVRASSRSLQEGRAQA